MRTKTFMFFATFLAFSFQVSMAASQTLNIKIHNIKSSKGGVIRIALFADEQGFRAEKSLFDVCYDKSKVKGGKLSVEIPVECGIYGISVLDDENNSGKMDYNLLGVPKKGFGFSNFILKKLRKPRFKDFSFTVTDKEQKNIEVKMMYL